jgi:high-affinity iron transporter
MLILLAAGLASNAARYLAQANLLSELGGQVWDSSWLLADGSVLGRILHILVGYDARPSGMMLLFYLVTASLLVIGMRYGMRRPPRVSGAAAQAAH